MAKEKPITVRQQIIDALSPVGKRVDSVTLRQKLKLDTARFEWNMKDACFDQVVLKNKIAGVRKNKARVEYELNPKQHHPERWNATGLLKASAAMDTLVRNRKPEAQDGV